MHNPEVVGSNPTPATVGHRNLLCVPFVAMIFYAAPTARADDASLSRTMTVDMKYVRGDNYKNRLINAQAAFNQMNAFFGRVEFKRGFNYSFLRDVLQGSMMPEQGY